MITPFFRRRLWPKSLAGKALALFGTALFLLVLAWFVALFVTERRLAMAMKRAEVEFGFSNNIDDYIPAILPPERNAMVPLDEAAALVAPFLQGLPFWNWSDDAESRLKSFPTLATSLRIEAVDRLLDEADRRPECSPTTLPLRPFLRNGGAPHVVRRQLHEGEALVGWLLAKEGKPNDAVRRLLRMLRISRKWTAVEPYLGDVVSDTSRRERILEILNDLLRTERIELTLLGAIDGEMIEQEKCFDTIARLYHVEKLKRLEDYKQNPFRQHAWWLVGPLAANDRLLIVDWYDLVLRHSQRPYAEANGELERADVELRRIMDSPVGRVFHPDAGGVTSMQQRRSFDFLVVRSRCLRIVNAMAKQQRWDAELDSLGLPNDALVDPINEGRLRVKQTPHGPIIYSVGFDLVDDGGTFDSKTLVGMDIGFGPSKAKEANK
jgi:hypothetical protein